MGGQARTQADYGDRLWARVVLQGNSALVLARISHPLATMPRHLVRRRVAALFSLLLIAPASAFSSGARGVAPKVGTYRAVTLDRHPLPAVERIAATDGYHHYVKLDEAVVSLRADGRFVASFRYFHHHLPNGAKIPDSPVLSESHRGTWVARGTTVILTPKTARGQRAPDPIIGTVAGTRMKVAYVVQEGAATRTLRLDLQRDAGW